MTEVNAANAPDVFEALMLSTLSVCLLRSIGLFLLDVPQRTKADLLTVKNVVNCVP